MVPPRARGPLLQSFGEATQLAKPAEDWVLRLSPPLAEQAATSSEAVPTAMTAASCFDGMRNVPSAPYRIRGEPLPNADTVWTHYRHRRGGDANDSFRA